MRKVCTGLTTRACVPVPLERLYEYLNGIGSSSYITRSCRSIAWRPAMAGVARPFCSLSNEGRKLRNTLISRKARFRGFLALMGADGEPQGPTLSVTRTLSRQLGAQTRVSGLVIRELPHRGASRRLYFSPRKNEGIAEGRKQHKWVVLVIVIHEVGLDSP
jgi:hypothetical protein